MKTLIISLNSKYIHSAIAPWYLKAACADTCGEVSILEFTINESMESVLSAIYHEKPDVAAFSCYIWNISSVEKLASSLRKILPETAIVLGGPEVSYETPQLMQRYPFADFILSGEGEESLPALLRCIAGMKSMQGNQADVLVQLKRIPGLCFRSEHGVIDHPPAIVTNLDTLPSPYTEEMLSGIKNRILYFETSRGCPFSCTYCLSSTTSGTRVFSLDRVFAELDRLTATGIRQIKFVDRTFNANKQRAAQILQYILELDKKARMENKGEGLRCNFHFEIAADLLDEKQIELLINSPKGLFQVEAGVQSTNRSALEAVNRKTDIDTLLSNLRRLRASGNVHIHADLIAGLPYEDYQSFGTSFDQLFQVRPHQLQLGFLKLLKGTVLREDANRTGYAYRDEPPYELLAGRHLSYHEVSMLKDVEDLVERFYNSGRFLFTLDYVIGQAFGSPFRFFERFAAFLRAKGMLRVNIGLRDTYAVLDAFIGAELAGTSKDVAEEFLRVDFLASDDSGTLPEFMEKRGSKGFLARCFQYYKKAGTPKQLYKKVHFDQIKLQTAPGSMLLPLLSDEGVVLLFSYSQRDPVSGRFPYQQVTLDTI